MSKDVATPRDNPTKIVLIPAPWYDPFDKFDTFIAEAEKVLELTAKGTGLLKRFPLMFKPAVFRRAAAGFDTPDNAASRIRDVEQDAAEAEKLLESEFALLRAHLMIGLWGSLEALVFNVVVCFLVNRPELLKNERLSKIRVPLAFLDEPSKELRMIHVVEEMTQQLRTGLMSGVSRFETLLDLVGLSAPVEDDLRKALFETSQVRNLVVHRASFVDRKFQDACPWLKANIGAHFDVTAARYSVYCEAMAEYGNMLYERVRAAIS
jgi:hypothetical protein